MDRRARLIRIIRERSYKEGDFTLASGKKSSFYVDVKTTCLYPEGAKLIGELAAELVEREGLKIDGVGGMTLGADPIGTSVSLAGLARGHEWPAFIVRKEPKGHGIARYIEGTDNLPKGGNLLVVEDTMTTGGSSLQAVERLREAGYRVEAVLTVVDREEGGERKLASSGLRLLRLATLSEIRNS